MSTVQIPLPALSWYPAAGQATAPALLDFGEAEAAKRRYLPRWGFVSDSTTGINITFLLPADYIGSPTLTLMWYTKMQGSSSDGVRWDCYVLAATGISTGDADDIEVAEVDSVNAVTGVPSSDGGGYLVLTTITLTNEDVAEAGDLIMLALERDHDHADDDHAHTAYLLSAMFNYSDA